MSAAGLLLVGCTWMGGLENVSPSGTVPVATASTPPEVSTPSEPTSTSSSEHALVCRALNDRERNDLGKMNQTYHGVDPEDGMKDAAAVDAGAGYSVFATRLTTGAVTAWLGWVSDVSTAAEGEESYALHLAAIISGESWDGGPAPFGTRALAAAVRCVR